ncbi:alpha-N-acetylglucosaminidase N-terminal domain-containing protein [uncultured Bacteroides sp.]|uniref:alpha-N-acetylglucosaminidase N-terminal domain-containing protein n=1 Tax=uncultured Bacteroides sp. TaxID=162156 RepID=UPI0025D95E6E|nr:alpha-N-acetylglucosaminidase N-terminal domain-containing protein [uncultured Bacteroides sp.]
MIYMKHTWVTLAAAALICTKLPAQNLSLALMPQAVELAETSTTMESQTMHNAETAINHTSKPAKALIERVVGKKFARLFKVEALTAIEGRDVFEIESQNGKIILRGNSPVAVASALNWT